MIPKIIHYCWLSDSPMSEKAQKCMESWKKYLPDYEFIHWDFSKFPKGKSVWVDQAFNSGKYAFAADYIRLFALYNYGGIYLDTDVEVLKPYDDLLDLPYFIGQEKTPSGIEAATMAFPVGHPFIKRVLDRYENRPFVIKNGSLDMEPLPYIMRKCSSAEYEYHVINKKEDFVFDDSVLNVFSPDFFSPKQSEPYELTITHKTYSIHHFAATWVPPKIEMQISVKERMKRWLKKSCLLRKNIVIISNTDFDKDFLNAFGIKSYGPLMESHMETDDFLELVANPELFKEDNISFIKDKESVRYVGKDLNYPIAKIHDTKLEIHYMNCFSREQALNIWNRGVRNIRNKKFVFVLQIKDVRRIDFYRVCLEINHNVNLILI